MCGICVNKDWLCAYCRVRRRRADKTINFEATSNLRSCIDGLAAALPLTSEALRLAGPFERDGHRFASRKWVKAEIQSPVPIPSEQADIDAFQTIGIAVCGDDQVATRSGRGSA